ncbi:unnamed protein product [Arctia plantaginis]|uniref:Uncharacterized protein n=1 Tax=Arctia plantaginis TaxID=874455 RepID=A0A8S1B4P3_ARCPL|nr:unnamed protein product [Arctia plantaginis]CAB3252902.1 unnamed protein product [Arctia plantaginis]
MWQVTLHAVSQETVMVRARYTTGRTITLSKINGTYRSSDAHGANDGRSASGVPLGRRPRTAPPLRAVCTAAQPPHGSGDNVSSEPRSRNTHHRYINVARDAIH